MGCGNICGQHWSEPFSLDISREFVEFQRPLHRQILAQMREFHLYQLLGIEGPMPIATGADGFGQNHTGRIDGLKDSRFIDATGNFADQHRGHSFATEFLVDAEEIDLHHLLRTEIIRISTNESYTDDPTLDGTLTAHRHERYREQHR